MLLQNTLIYLYLLYVAALVLATAWCAWFNQRVNQESQAPLSRPNVHELDVRSRWSPEARRGRKQPAFANLEADWSAEHARLFAHAFQRIRIV